MGIGSGPQINTCRKVPLRSNFLDDDILPCLLYEFYLSTCLPVEEEGWMTANLFCLRKSGRRLLPVQLRHGGQGRQAHRAPQRGQEPCLQACNRSRTFGSEISQYTVQCKENPIDEFLFWDFTALVPISTFTCLLAACSTRQGKSHLCILFLGIARPQSQFLHCL
jgi:hypothetical protein